MYWKTKTHFLKIIWIQVLLLNFKYKLFCEIRDSKIQVIKKMYIVYRYLLFTYLFIYFYWVLCAIILLGVINTKFVDTGKMKFVEYSFKNS